MKIAICSDIHGNQYALNNFFKDIETQKIDKVLFLGDVFGYYYGQKECLQKLMECNKVYCIKGNHDQYFLDLKKNPAIISNLVTKYGSSYANTSQITSEQVKFISNLPLYAEMTLDSLKLFFCHGSLDNYLEGRVYPDSKIENENLYCKYDFVFLGHTHHKMVKLLNNTVVCNPGSLGQQRDGLGCSYVVFDTLTKVIHYKIVVFDVDFLSKEVELKDPSMSKLKEVLFRVNSNHNE